MPRMSGGHAVVRTLQAEGVGVAFGLPGMQIMPLYDGFFEEPRVRIVTVRHEQAAGYMADGYARSTGRIGVAVVVPGPGLYNAGAALATAYAASGAVLLITGQVDRELAAADRDALHQLHAQLDVVSPVTKWRLRVCRVEEVPEAIHEAVHRLRSGRPRPVAVEIPRDVLAEVADIEIGEAEPVWPASPDTRSVDAAAALLAEARYPVIWAGGGVNLADAALELVDLAECLEAPVLTTAEGRGAIPDDHRLAMGVATGFKAFAAAPAFIPHADVILAVGTRFAVPATAPWRPRPPQRLVHLDIDPREFGRFYPATVGIAADAKLGLGRLREILANRPRRAAWDPEQLATHRRSLPERGRAVVGRYFDIYREMRAVLGPDAIVISGITGLGYGADEALPVLRPRTWITSSYMGTLGYELSTALGVKVGNPDRPVVAIVGDGGLLYAIGELATAVQHRINVVTLLYNNGAFGASNNDQRSRYGGRVVGTELHNPDFVRLAESFGVRAFRVTEPEAVPGALKQAIADPGPTLVELVVPTGHMPMEIYGPLHPPLRPSP